MAAEGTMSNSSNGTQHPPDRQVILEGGLPWGFRIQGGSDTGFPLRIARVIIHFLKMINSISKGKGGGVGI